MTKNQLTKKNIDDLEWEYINMHNFFSESKKRKKYMIKSNLKYSNKKRKIFSIKQKNNKNKHCENQQIVRDKFKNKLNFIKKKLELKESTNLENVYLNIINIFSEYKINYINNELDKYLKNNKKNSNRFYILRSKYNFYKSIIIKCLKLKENISTINLYNEIIKKL